MDMQYLKRSFVIPTSYSAAQSPTLLNGHKAFVELACTPYPNPSDIHNSQRPFIVHIVHNSCSRTVRCDKCGRHHLPLDQFQGPQAPEESTLRRNPCDIPLTPSCQSPSRDPIKRTKKLSVFVGPTWCQLPPSVNVNVNSSNSHTNYLFCVWIIRWCTQWHPAELSHQAKLQPISKMDSASCLSASSFYGTPTDVCHLPSHDHQGERNGNGQITTKLLSFLCDAFATLSKGNLHAFHLMHSHFI